MRGLTGGAGPCLPSGRKGEWNVNGWHRLRYTQDRKGYPLLSCFYTSNNRHARSGIQACSENSVFFRNPVMLGGYDFVVIPGYGMWGCFSLSTAADRDYLVLQEGLDFCQL